MRFAFGLPETPCGKGSMLENTGNVRRALPPLLKELGVGRVLDAPCGDCNWFPELEIEYLGLDNDAKNLALAREKRPGLEFRLMDILNEELPESDLLLCRDFFQHIPNAAIRRFLSKMNTKYLLATSHRNAATVEIKCMGGFRPVNLRHFGLGEPLRIVEDCGRDLALWSQ